MMNIGVSLDRVKKAMEHNQYAKEKLFNRKRKRLPFKFKDFLDNNALTSVFVLFLNFRSSMRETAREREREVRTRRHPTPSPGETQSNFVR